MSAAAPRVLVVGGRSDPHVQRVLSCLGEPAVVLDPWAFAPSTVTFGYTGDGVRVRVAHDGAELELGDVRAVWWRLKPSMVEGNPRLADPVTASFVEREWVHVVESLGALLPEASWVNPRAADRRARHKPMQLVAATQAGFEIPPTLIGNDARAAGEFVRANGDDAVYKALDFLWRPPDRMLFTNRVSSALVERSGGEIAMAPCIFQRRLEKQYELRVTVVGEEAFPIRIDSTAHPGARLDWRRKQTELDYRRSELPAEVHERLLGLHRSLGLVYGAYDLIVTPEGEHVFLEVNPLGQWLWLEEATGAPISAALARALSPA